MIRQILIWLLYVWFIVRIYVAVDLAVYGLGSYKTRANLQDSPILIVVFVYDCTLPIIYMEKGKKQGPQAALKVKCIIRLSTIFYLIKTPVWKIFVILVWGGCDWRYRRVSDHSRNYHSSLEGRGNDCVSCSPTWYHGSWVHTREGWLFSSFWRSFVSLVYISPGNYTNRSSFGKFLSTN